MTRNAIVSAAKIPIFMNGRPCTDAPEAVANIDVTATGGLIGAADAKGDDICGSNPSMATESAATRAAERRASSARDRHALMPNAAAAATEAHVRTMSTVSMFSLPQREFHRHFDNDIHWRPAQRRRRKAPLPHRLNRALIESKPEALQHFHVAHRSIAEHDDLEHHIAGDPAAPGFVGVFG